MGERYQIHIKTIYEDKLGRNELISIHAQWMWGEHIIRNLNRLFKTLKNTTQVSGYESLGEYIKSILTVNKDLDGKQYPYRVHLEPEPYKTDEGDSNHGWVVIFININDNGTVCKIRSQFYTVHGMPKINGELWQDAEMDISHQNWKQKDVVKLKKMLDPKFFNNTNEGLQDLFNKAVEELRKEKEEVKQLSRLGTGLEQSSPTISPKSQVHYVTGIWSGCLNEIFLFKDREPAEIKFKELMRNYNIEEGEEAESPHQVVMGNLKVS